MSVINRYTLLKAFHNYKSLDWHDYETKGIYLNLFQSKNQEQVLEDTLAELRSEGLIKLLSHQLPQVHEITEEGEQEYQNILNDKQDQLDRKRLELQLLTANNEIAKFQKGLGKRLSIFGFILSLFALIVAITAIVVTHNDTKPVPFTYDTTIAITRLNELERRLRAIEKIKASDTIAHGNSPTKSAETSK